MNPSRGPQTGEVVRVGAPAAGEVTITVDPAIAGTAFAAGTYALSPKAEIPVHRLLERDELLVIYKGQGRATLREQSMVVVPGSILFVPRGAWQGLRNTGTGALQFVWVASPPGLEVFFRELSHLGASPSPAALQELAQRYGIELRGPAEPSSVVPAASGQQRRRHRGGRRHRGRRAAAASGVSGSSAVSAPAAASTLTPVVPRDPASSAPAPKAPAVLGDSRRRHRGRRGWRGHGRRGSGARSTTSAVAQPPRETTGKAPSAPPATSASGSARPAAGRQRSSRGPRWRRGKEVYMGGKWVRVEGEGPMIAPGSSRPESRHPKRDDDDDPPRIRLSVPL